MVLKYEWRTNMGLLCGRLGEFNKIGHEPLEMNSNNQQTDFKRLLSDG